MACKRSMKGKKVVTLRQKRSVTEVLLLDFSVTLLVTVVTLR